MDIERSFLEPGNATHRQYEALRAFFVDQLSYNEAARRFGYTEGSFKVLCSEFRRAPHRQFFVEPQLGRRRKHHEEPQATDIRELIVALRKQNLSVYDIAERLDADGRKLSPPAIARILKEEGFAKRPRRRDDERSGGNNIAQAPVADVGQLDLSPRSFRTRFGGLFLFLPFLAAIDLDSILNNAGFRGSKMIPAAHAIRAFLALKMFGNARHTHVMSDVFDEGLGFLSGLNVSPKASYLTQYSTQIHPNAYPKLIDQWFDAVADIGYGHGASFDLDFHTIPFHGEDALVEKHYISKRSRRQKGILSFVANDTENRAFCYVNADIRKKDVADEILRFAEFWNGKAGMYPEELIFDSQLTTYKNLDRLNQKQIDFITLRRRTAKVLDEINAAPHSAWRRVELQNIARAYRTPKVLDMRITLNDYQGTLRQLAIRDLGHEQPTIIITNQMKRRPATLIQRYARRMIIENNISDAIDFFHMDALSSTVAMKVNCDLVLTLMASTLYRLFARRIGHGYEHAEFATIFRDFINAVATVTITEAEIHVHFQRRSHNPILLKAGFAEDTPRIPWLGGKTLRFIF